MKSQLSNSHIGYPETVAMLALVVGGKAFDYTITMISEAAGTAGVVQHFISAFFAAIGIFIMISLLKAYPGLHLLQILSILFGKPIAKIIGMTLFVTVLMDTVIVLASYALLIQNILLPTTPLYVVTILLLLTTFYPVYLGIETITRSIIVIIPTVLTIFALALSLSTGIFHTDYLFPIFGNGWSIVPSGFLMSGFYGEFLFVSILAAHYRQTHTIQRSTWVAFALSFVILEVAVFASTTSFDYPINSEQVLPLYQLARTIHVSRFLQRIDALFAFVALIAVIVRIGVLSYITTLVFAQVWKLPSLKPIIPGIGILIYYLSLLPKNIVQLIELRKEFLIPLGVFSLVMLPSLSYVMYLIRGKKKEQEQGDLS